MLRANNCTQKFMSRKKANLPAAKAMRKLVVLGCGEE